MAVSLTSLHGLRTGSAANHSYELDAKNRSHDLDGAMGSQRDLSEFGVYVRSCSGIKMLSQAELRCLDQGRAR